MANAFGWASLEGAQPRGDQGHLMRREHILPLSEVIRGIASEYSLCCGVPAPQPVLVRDVVCVEVVVGHQPVHHLVDHDSGDHDPGHCRVLADRRRHRRQPVRLDRVVDDPHLKGTHKTEVIRAV